MTTTINILEELGNFYGITKFKCVCFPSSVMLQDSDKFNSKYEKFVKESLNIRKEFGIPFWESIVINLIGKPEFGNDLLPLVDHHNYLDNAKWVSLSELKELINDGSNIGVMSEVNMGNGNIRHIPMLDFHIPVSHHALELVEKVCRCLSFNKGVILNSGASYHFIGYDLLEERTINDILYHALLYGPITDCRWIAHQLIEGVCTLRCSRKNGVLPKLEKEL